MTRTRERLIVVCIGFVLVPVFPDDSAVVNELPIGSCPSGAAMGKSPLSNPMEPQLLDFDSSVIRSSFLPCWDEIPVSGGFQMILAIYCVIFSQNPSFEAVAVGVVEPEPAILRAFNLGCVVVTKHLGTHLAQCRRKFLSILALCGNPMRGEGTCSHDQQTYTCNSVKTDKP